MLTPREKSPLPKMSPEEDRTRGAVDSEPKHYQLSYSGSELTLLTELFLPPAVKTKVKMTLSTHNHSSLDVCTTEICILIDVLRLTYDVRR